VSDYVAGHVQEALAHAGETDVHVRVEPNQLLLTGTVATQARRDAAVAIADRVAEGLAVRDEITVLRQREPDAEEVLGS
jgi:osmotically-inducible protein OsmY